MPKNNSKGGPDLNKVENIIDTLRRFPQGIWLRKLSRESEMPPSTVKYYLDEIIDSFIDSQGARDDEGNFFGIRLIKLKDGIKKQLESGKSIEYLLRAKGILTENGE